MLVKTHFAIGLFTALLFLPHVANKAVFLAVVLLVSLIPDVDSGFSTLGRNILFRPIQLFTKHRGFFHSFTLCFGVSFLLAWFLPVLALPFFLGYASHLAADSFTVDGIRPLWPSKKVIQGGVRVGGVTERTIFIIFLLIDALLLALLLFGGR